MIARILVGLGFGIIVIIIAFWVISGGPSKVATAAKAQPNFIEGVLNGNLLGSVLSIQLPWRGSIPDLQSPDISRYIDKGPEDTIASGHSREELDQARSFGMPSPYRSLVSLREAHAAESNPAKEYVTISGARDNDGSIDLTGWSVQSAVSGRRLYLPEAATVFIGGAINSSDHVMLAPGASAIIASGVSPVGISFRENICSGYLGKLQSFHPGLGLASCPRPSDALPETAENLRAYGSNCLDYVRDLSPCEFPQGVPATLSLACHAFVLDTFSYNGCVRMYRDKPSFPRNSWHLYLNSQYDLWDNAHDIIRLLDAQGRTVDAVTY